MVIPYYTIMVYYGYIHYTSLYWLLSIQDSNISFFWYTYHLHIIYKSGLPQTISGES